ncbi:MAG: hypothetical protein IPN34_22660 [Planctomycetes bacterium]|nr:hypothetical protein [Planctomycetota bacterium]
MHPTFLLALLFTCALAPELAAQSRREILGSTANAATRSAVAKGSSIRVDQTVVLEYFEIYLDFRGEQDLEFSVFRCYDEAGSYAPVARVVVPTNGQGRRWYSSGTLDLFLLCGSHYLLAVSWPGSATYFYDTAEAQTLSFGEHTFGYALGVHPLPASIATSSNDYAVYNLALKTHLPDTDEPDVRCSGESCSTSATRAPELGASGAPFLGTASFELQLFGAPEGTLGTVLLAPALLTTPLPLLGSCELYLELSSASFSLGAASFDATRFARFPFPLPNDGTLRGQSVALQGFAVDAASALAVANALELSLW